MKAEDILNFGPKYEETCTGRSDELQASRIFVGSLKKDQVSKDDMFEWFSEYGKITAIRWAP